ncbi:MAG: NAD(P)H-hydrate dehydratase [Candidatus Omnitrophica bacterium]|nr:NAD(P)H-hydrate dehydratase [Candidatus Omnitrophota bacterium]
MAIQKEIQKLLPRRKRETHKGDYGKIFILAGSRGMSGACVLAGMAALRSGAGLVTVGIPKSLALPLTKRFVELMTKPLPETKDGALSFGALKPIKTFLKTQNVFAVGPGLSRNPQTSRLIRKLVLASAKSMVIDADGLNAFQGETSLFCKLKTPAVLTPHPGEFIRLFHGASLRNEKERLQRARDIARKFKVILVLKGSKTVVASPQGNVYINITGNPGMATAGSGDVLLGVIAALLGQGLKPFDAACAGVYVHGLAGDIAVKKVGEVSLVAGDIVENLPRAFRKVLER